MSYAQGTSVPVIRSQMEIAALLVKSGASRHAFAAELGRVVVYFEAHGRHIRFEMPLPDPEAFKRHPKSSYRMVSAELAHRKWEAACRERWRALLLTIKAKFVSVENKVETFEEAFLAHVVIPGTGETVAQRTLPAIAQAYLHGESTRPLLGDGR